MNRPNSEEEPNPSFEEYTNTHNVTTVRLRFRIQPVPGSGSTHSPRPPTIHPYPDPTRVSLQGHVQCGAWAIDGVSLPPPRSGLCYSLTNGHPAKPTYSSFTRSRPCRCYYMYHSPLCIYSSGVLPGMQCCSCLCMCPHMCPCGHACVSLCPCAQIRPSEETDTSEPAEQVVAGSTGSTMTQDHRRDSLQETVTTSVEETAPESPSELVLGQSLLLQRVITENSSTWIYMRPTTAMKAPVSTLDARDARTLDQETATD